MTTWTPRLSLPVRWPRWSDPETGVLVHATAPDRRSEHLASITLLLDPAGGGPSGPAGRLPGDPAAVLEEEALHRPGTGAAPIGYRRWSLRLAGVELIRDEWHWPGLGPPALLRCTATPYSYQQFAELFATVAASVRFETPTPGTGSELRQAGPGTASSV